MKKYFAKFKQITVACAITMLLYLATYWITSALMNEAAEPMYRLVLGIYSLVLMSVFDLILIRFAHIKKSVGEKAAMQDFKDGYRGLKTDISFLFKRELPTLITLAMINGASWILISLDKLIFSKRTVTAVLLLYAPLNVIGVALPEWGNSILGYLLGTVFCYAIYLAELAMLRKKWYKHWNGGDV